MLEGPECKWGKRHKVHEGGTLMCFHNLVLRMGFDI